MPSSDYERLMKKPEIQRQLKAFIGVLQNSSVIINPGKLVDVRRALEQVVQVAYDYGLEGASVSSIEVA